MRIRPLSCLNQSHDLVVRTNIQVSGANPSPLAFPSYEPGSQLGILYGTVSKVDGYYQYTSNSSGAFGKICGVATITPAGIHSIITNGWNVVQRRMVHEFMNGTTNGVKTYDPTWTPDGPDHVGFNKTIVPDTNDNLYTIDGPNIAQFGATNSFEKYCNFYDYITWNSQICCDTNNLWEFQGRWNASQVPQITFVSLGTNNITLPTTP
jgi:hypothetical protein